MRWEPPLWQKYTYLESNQENEILAELHDSVKGIQGKETIGYSWEKSFEIKDFNTAKLNCAREQTNKDEYDQGSDYICLRQG